MGVYKNDKGPSVDMTHVFDKPITTQAIRLQRNGMIKWGVFRVTEIDVFGVDGKQIKPAGARTDNAPVSSWRKTTWAPELYDDSARWGNNHGVHFSHHATMWFDQPVTIKSIQIPLLHCQEAVTFFTAIVHAK